MLFFVVGGMSVIVVGLLTWIVVMGVVSVKLVLAGVAIESPRFVEEGIRLACIPSIIEPSGFVLVRLVRVVVLVLLPVWVFVMMTWAIVIVRVSVFVSGWRVLAVVVGVLVLVEVFVLVSRATVWGMCRFS